MRPRREPATAAVRGRPLHLGAVPLPQLLHFVAALDGRLRGVGGASRSDVVGHILPVVSAEVTAAEGVPLILVRVDEGGRFVGRPTRGRKAAGGGGGGGREGKGGCGNVVVRRSRGWGGDRRSHEGLFG